MMPWLKPVYLYTIASKVYSYASNSMLMDGHLLAWGEGKLSSYHMYMYKSFQVDKAPKQKLHEKLISKVATRQRLLPQ